jgi:RNA-directed DNA polymerase
MTATKMEENMSPGLSRVARRAKDNPEERLRSLAHHLDEDALTRAYHRIRKDAAVGLDGVSKEAYGEALEANIRQLWERMKGRTYRHQPIRRVLIPKGQGKMRPIGISTVEDKIVQGALTELLEVIYEPVFSDSSYGFRPRRRVHDALAALDRVLYRGEVSFILEADIQSFFDSIDRKKLMEMLRERIDDESLARLIGKCLHVGVLDGEQYTVPDGGTVQGSALSPMLGNVYLHHVLDLWFEREVQPRLRGKATLIRYADDFVIAFERQDDAQRVMAVIGQRFERFGLTLHPDKTRLVPFSKPPTGGEGKGPGTLDFLGFTVYWQRSRKGRWVPRFKTRGVKLRDAISRIAEWCRRHRHDPVKEQHAALSRRLNGHYNFYGVNGNLRSLKRLRCRTIRTWWKWLNRRSQKRSKTWAQMKAMLQHMPLPPAVIRVQLWCT